MAIHLHGIAVKNFRGIDNQYQEAIGLGRFNFFIGPNNAGKSTMLDLVHRYLPIPRGGRSIVHQPQLLDTNRSANSGPLAIRLATPVSTVLNRITKNPNISQDSRLNEYAQKVVSWMEIDGYIWLEGAPPFDRMLHWGSNRDPLELASLLPNGELNRLWTALCNMTGGGLKDWTNDTINAIAEEASLGLPEILLIPAFRRIVMQGDAGSEVSGAGLIDRLAQLQNPPLEKREDATIFQKINAFVREVTNRPDAQIEIPYAREHILVHMDGRILPLESLGTGIHQVIMLAAFCTVYDDRIFCLEEPELHLHPLLQRRLIEYLEVNTNNQYLIATHSAAFIDTPGASIYRVWQEDGATRLRRTISRQQRFEICDDLGHRASDLLQSNAIIWVEGPSDRIYINHWLKAVDPKLEEGLHYSVMFYGGRLLSHLSADADEVGEFIALRELNRNLAIVIDSDKKSAQSKINDTKRRVVDELNDNGLAWVTKGREIENYVQHEILQKIVRSTTSNYGSAADGGQFDHALSYFKSRAKTGEPDELVEKIDKVRVAKLVCQAQADLSVLDLNQRIRELADFICRANGLKAGEEQIAA